MEEIERLIDSCECGNKEIKVGYDDYHENPLSMVCTKCGKEQIKTVIKEHKMIKTGKHSGRIVEDD